ncbi:DUF1835 domain-containing protein [Paenibacillus sp. 22594]|uniref:DUF1835 domain-containing protein n=1 Tax=Paenibacillus sp. 22594 TaxID=3453947 RepID=UPI003F84C8F3
MYDELMGQLGKVDYWDPGPDCTHVHVVVGDSFAGSMKQALKNLGWSDLHKLIILRDNYAIGPLGGLDSPEGRLSREKWFREHISHGLERYTVAEYEDEYAELLGMLKRIPQQAVIVLWISRSVREQTGIRHALYLLRGTVHRISLYDACEICEGLFNTPGASIIYRSSGEIPADKLREAFLRMDSNGLLDSSAVNHMQDQWIQIAEKNGVLRIWEDSGVVEVAADYYDNYLLEKLDSLRPPKEDQGFVKSARLVGEVLGYCDQHIGDSYFEYRIRQLINDGILEIKGIPAAMRFYSIRRQTSSVTD